MGCFNFFSEPLIFSRLFFYWQIVFILISFFAHTYMYVVYIARNYCSYIKSSNLQTFYKFPRGVFVWLMCRTRNPSFVTFIRIKYIIFANAFSFEGCWSFNSFAIRIINWLRVSSNLIFAIFGTLIPTYISRCDFVENVCEKVFGLCNICYMFNCCWVVVAFIKCDYLLVIFRKLFCDYLSRIEFICFVRHTSQGFLFWDQ